MPNVSESESVPLSFGQKARLFVQFVPLVFFVAVCAIYLVALTQYFGPPPVVFVAFMALVIIAIGFGVIGFLLDLIAGVAIVRDDVILERSWISRGQRWGYYGRFEGFGRMRMVRKAFRDAIVGQHHRIVYSPRSRFVWSVEPILNGPLRREMARSHRTPSTPP